MLREVSIRRRALPPARFAALRDALLGSPLVGQSTLGNMFEASRGFAVIFTEAGRAQVLSHFRELEPHFEAVLGKPAVKALTPFFRRVGPRIPNAWYLNVLLVPEGGRVARHLDVTLRSVAQVDDAVPEMVSVLYLRVPAAKGGDLRLSRGDGPAQYIAPQDNTLVHFRGDLLHEVCAFYGSPAQVRASLVIEQYHFAPEALARVPAFRLESRAGFGAFLEHHRARPVPEFDVEP